LGSGAYGFTQGIDIVKYNEIHLQCNLCRGGDTSYFNLNDTLWIRHTLYQHMKIISYIIFLFMMFMISDILYSYSEI